MTFDLDRVQQRGGKIQEIRAGDVAWFHAGVKHWHGAAPTTALTHIAIQEEAGGSAVEWLEHVNDEQYRSSGRKSNTKNVFREPECRAFSDYVRCVLVSF